MTDRYLTIPLGVCASDSGTPLAAGTQLQAGDIPFAVVPGGRADHLDLAEVCWPEWQTDPSAFYAAYDTAPSEPDRRRPFVTVPVADYLAAYLLITADRNPARGAIVSLRIGVFAGEARTDIRDFSVTVPRDEAQARTQGVATLETAAGTMFVVRVPIGQAWAQDFADRERLQVEITKELRLAIRRPDPCRFQYRPLGPISGVRIFAMTFARSPVQMTVRPTQSGGVFVSPEVPAFAIELTGDLSAGPCRVAGVARDADGTIVAQCAMDLPAARGQFSMPLSRLGWYAVTLTLTAGSEVLLCRQTNIALLAPDTRTHRESAPWGVWDFSGRHFTPDTGDEVGPLYQRAGLRYGMFHYPDATRQQYGVLQGNDPTVKNAEMARELAERRAAQGLPAPARVMIFHEDAISAAHVMRQPVACGGRAYAFDAVERERFDRLWHGAIAAATEVRRLFPQTEIYFGNGNIQLLEAFLERGFPRELFDARGNEAGSFQRLPECQPPDFVANNASLWMDAQVLAHYGYADVPLRQCYEICYPSTNPGNLSLTTQAAYLVRHILHSMAWEIPIIRFGCLSDAGNSYYYSNWGASGLCQAKPNLAPKPAYVAVAVLTRMLDGAVFSRAVPAPPALYAVSFKRPDQREVTCLWTARGEQLTSLKTTDNEAAQVWDMMGNELVLSAPERAEFRVGPQPCYVVTERPLAAVSCAAAEGSALPAGERFEISALTSLDEWTIVDQLDHELAEYEFLCPRRRGNFQFLIDDDGTLSVTPVAASAGAECFQMYASLRHVRGIEIPGQPGGIGLMVDGNGGWGRLIFELTDAAGQRWISIGCEQSGEPTAWMADWMPAAQLATSTGAGIGDWNTSDAWGRSSICFEGWQYLNIELPGNYPGEGYHWPGSSQWRFSGDGIVHYPLTFRRLIITLPAKVLKFRDYRPVPQQTVRLRSLMVTYAGE